MGSLGSTARSALGVTAARWREETILELMLFPANKRGLPVLRLPWDDLSDRRWDEGVQTSGRADHMQ